MPEASLDDPRFISPRLIGAVYLGFFVTAALGLYLTRGVVSPGDAAATANAIQAHGDLFRAGFAVTLVSNVLYIGVTALFYRFFGPVNWAISLMAAFFSLAGCVVQIAGGLLQVGALAVLADGPMAKAFSVQQLQAASLFSLGLYSQSFTISLVLFAVYDLLLGWLVLASGFVPKALGVLLVAAGLGWATFLWPPLAKAVGAFVMPLGALAEIALMLWLLTRSAASS